MRARTITATKLSDRSVVRTVRVTQTGREAALIRLSRKCGGRDGFHRDGAYVGPDRWLGQPMIRVDHSSWSLGPMWSIDEEETAVATYPAHLDAVSGRLWIETDGEDTDLIHIGGLVLPTECQLEPWGEDEYDFQRADDALADGGWRRVGEWDEARAPENITCLVEPTGGQPGWMDAPRNA
ncbi:MAG: hypothetical protein AB1416_08330 [Actinomycetota bacterium]